MGRGTVDASTVWSKEKRDHLYGEGMQQQDENTSSASQDIQQQPQPPSQKQRNLEERLDEDPTIQVASCFANEPQISSGTYQQQRQLVFGQILPITGPNQFILDDEFRAAAKKSPMLWGFMQAVDQVEKQQQEQAKEPH